VASLPYAVNCGMFCFWRRQSVLIRLSIKYLENRAPNSHVRRTCLVPRSGEFEVQGQKSKVNVTRDKNGIFSVLSAACLVKHL